MSDCTAWLKRYLSAGWKTCDEVRAAATEAGYSKRDLQIARAELRVVPGSVTIWQLPKEDT